MLLQLLVGLLKLLTRFSFAHKLHTHILQEPYLVHQFEGEFYGAQLKLIIVGFIRDMKQKFANLGSFCVEELGHLSRYSYNL